MKELEDYPRFPRLLRNYQTDFIGFMVSFFRIYAPFTRYLKSLSLPQQTMLDLCSGSGEPAITIFNESGCFSHLLLTDKYPNETISTGAHIFYLPGNRDVLKMEFSGENCYTMFNAFHHFSGEEKRAIVRKIQAAGSRAFFVEILEPRFFVLLKILFTTLIGTFLFTPFVKPFSWKRLLFTYLVPVNLFTITYDGIVSVFKSATVAQYQDIFNDSAIPPQVFKIKKGLSPLIVIEIKPK